MICQSCRAALCAQRLSPAPMRRRLLSSISSSSSLPSSLPSSSSSRAFTPLFSTTTLSPSRRFLSSSSSSSSSPSSSEAQPADQDATPPQQPHMTPAEASIAALLTSKLHPTQLLVQDVSGGCGSMYAIDITSPAFRGLSILKQQRLVNAALGDLVKQWHGVQLRTKVPPEEGA